MTEVSLQNIIDFRDSLKNCANDSSNEIGAKFRKYKKKIKSEKVAKQIDLVTFNFHLTFPYRFDNKIIYLISCVCVRMSF